MELSFRLKDVIEERVGHRRGNIKDICDFTGLERHAVAALYHGRTKYLSLETLSMLCDYLTTKHGVDRAQLPAILFREEGEFWRQLASVRRLELSVGVRERSHERLAVASDLVLQGRLLGCISKEDVETGKLELHDFVQHLLPNPPVKGRSAATMEEAGRVYRAFKRVEGPRAFVALGSVKSNPAVELVLARAFGLTECDRRSGTSPIYFRYGAKARARPDSCCAGTTAPRPARSRISGPGLCYETKDGRWEHCPDSDDETPALLFYVHRTAQRRLEMVLGGFSALGTECLAHYLTSLKPADLRPCWQTPSLEVGALIIRFKIEDGDRAAGASLIRRPEKIRLDPEVLARRVGRD